MTKETPLYDLDDFNEHLQKVQKKTTYSIARIMIVYGLKRVDVM